MIRLTSLFDDLDTNSIRHWASAQKNWEEYTDPKSFLKCKRVALDSEFILDKVSDFMEIPVDKLQTPIVIKYEKGDYFNWHNDIMLTGEENQHTCVVQLSNHDEYSGGNLEVNMGGERPFDLDRNEGEAIVFPSSLQHRVTEITRGERWALIVWGTP
jgi:predicted 2-oxoglutarate/Fe(II)-dependent dioxygenase YbiX